MNADDPNSAAKQVDDFLEAIRNQIAQAKPFNSQAYFLAEQMRQLPLSDKYPGQAISTNEDLGLFDFSETKILGICETQGEEYSAVQGKIMGHILPVEVSTVHGALPNILAATGRLVSEAGGDSFERYNYRMNKVLLGTHVHQLGIEDFFEGPAEELSDNVENTMSLEAGQAKVVAAARESLGGLTIVQSRSGSDRTNFINKVVLPFLHCKVTKQQVVICCATDTMADTIAGEIDAELTTLAERYAHVSRQYIVRIYLEAPSYSDDTQQNAETPTSTSKDLGIHGTKLFQEVLRNASVIVSTTPGIAARRVTDAIQSSTTSLILEGNTTQTEMNYLPIFVARFKRDPKILVLGNLSDPLPPAWIGPARFALARQTQLTFMKRMVTIGHRCIILDTAHGLDPAESDDPKPSTDACKTAQAKPAESSQFCQVHHTRTDYQVCKKDSPKVSRHER